MLDGELVAGQSRASDFYRLVAGQSRASDFYRLGPQLARRLGAQAVTFAAFDVLHVAGEPTIDLMWRHASGSNLSLFEQRR